MPIRIGNGAGFLGDQLSAPRELVESSQLDFLTLEYLAELTMSILAYQKQKQPQLGFARDLLDVLGSLQAALRQQPQLKIITNGGGMNPRACTIAAARQCVAADLNDLRLGCVTGDDLLPHMDALQAVGCRFENLDDGRSFQELGKPAVAANAYLGAAPLVECLRQDARIVISGRVADASLTVAPCVYSFAWNWDAWPQLAGASVAGHLIECGAQVTGGYSQRWRDLHLDRVGYPIAEIEADGSTVITKPAGSGGRIDRQSVVEQLVYEINDPRCYKTPDINVDFTTVLVADCGADRVAVRGATGVPPGSDYKVSLAYHDGYMASGQLVVAGRDALEKAAYCAEIVRLRVARAGFQSANIHAECLGAGQALPGCQRPPETSEVVLRLTIYDASREAAERFTREIAPLITSGPAGLAGYAAARSEVRPVFAYWPTMVPKTMVEPQVEVRSAAEWVALYDAANSAG